jgi:ankyrin repeat protein
VLHLLCLRGNVDSVREVLSRGAITDIDAANDNGETALQYGTRRPPAQQSLRHSTDS